MLYLAYNTISARVCVEKLPNGGREGPATTVNFNL